MSFKILSAVLIFTFLSFEPHASAAGPGESCRLALQEQRLTALARLQLRIAREESSDKSLLLREYKEKLAEEKSSFGSGFDFELALQARYRALLRNEGERDARKTAAAIIDRERERFATTELVKVIANAQNRTSGALHYHGGHKALIFNGTGGESGIFDLKTGKYQNRSTVITRHRTDVREGALGERVFISGPGFVRIADLNTRIAPIYLEEIILPEADASVFSNDRKMLLRFGRDSRLRTYQLSTVGAPLESASIEIAGISTLDIARRIEPSSIRVAVSGDGLTAVVTAVDRGKDNSLVSIVNLQTQTATPAVRADLETRKIALLPELGKIVLLSNHSLVLFDPLSGAQTKHDTPVHEANFALVIGNKLALRANGGIVLFDPLTGLKSEIADGVGSKYRFQRGGPSGKRIILFSPSDRSENSSIAVLDQNGVQILNDRIPIETSSIQFSDDGTLALLWGPMSHTLLEFK